MTTTMDPTFSQALRGELVARAEGTPRRRRRRITVAGGAAALVALALGGVPAAIGRDVPDAPLAPPVIVNGVGSTNVVLPPVPEGAAYLSVLLACYDSVVCATPSASAGSPSAGVSLATDLLPVTDTPDPVRLLERLDPAAGLRITTDRGAHWRLVATYSERRSPRVMRLGDGRPAGIFGASSPVPWLIPVVADNGRSGYTPLYDLLDGAHPTLVPSGTEENPLPVLDEDGRTVIGVVTVDRPYIAD